VITVVLEKDPTPDGHTGSATRQHRDGNDPDAPRQIGVDHVVRCEFGTFETAHCGHDRPATDRGGQRMVSDHYTRVSDLAATILAAYGDTDIGIDDLAPADEFHLGGAAATAAVAADLGLDAAGIDLVEVADLLEAEGLASFATSFDDLIAALEAKAVALR